MPAFRDDARLLARNGFRNFAAARETSGPGECSTRGPRWPPTVSAELREQPADGLGWPPKAAFQLPLLPGGGPPPPRGAPQRPGPRGALVGRAAERKAYIAAVEVSVKEGFDMAFADASLQNCRYSFREPGNLRFDLLVDQDDLNKFMLLEVYDSAEGPVAHKATAHYNEWREAVADWMAEPRSATQWDVVFPEEASDLEPKCLVVERPYGNEIFTVLVERLEIIPGSDVMFQKFSSEYARTTRNREDGCLRADLWRNVDDPNKFLILRAYRTPDVIKKHKSTGHYIKWRRDVGSYIKDGAPVGNFKTYGAIFPTSPAAWSTPRDD
ncbi:unnamed protein product [Prorocentrum cordatum]|uniref:ABM domain-containing protein n=1 Tax=Prorocentrum cordatum TaxID=2364126 RepID=A0ABN9VNT2_9DINO|nr:unnamed protein product [Polarella glacialis]